MGEAEVEKLPDPETFRDAVLLAEVGSWSPQSLDDTDALLLALVRRLRNIKRG